MGIAEGSLNTNFNAIVNDKVKGLKEGFISEISSHLSTH